MVGKPLRRLFTNLVLAGILFFSLEALGQGLFFLRHGYSFRQSLAYLPDPHLSWRVNPDYLGKNAFDLHEGFRGKAPQRPKPPGGYRIFCLGGSTTFCGDLPAKKTWPFLLEEELNRGAGFRKFEVINAGGDGYRIEQCQIWFDREVGFLKPDAIILHVGWNEIGTFGGQTAFFPLNVGNPNRLSERLLGRMAHHSLWICKFATWYRNRTQRTPQENAALQQATLSFEPDFLSLEDRLREFVQRASRSGVRVFLVRYPCLIDTTLRPEERRLIEERLPGMFDRYPLIDQIHQKTLAVLERVARSEKVALLDVASAFQRIPIEKRIGLFNDPRHTSEEGNRLMADVMAEMIVRRRPRGVFGRRRLSGLAPDQDKETPSRNGRAAYAEIAPSGLLHLVGVK